MEVRLLGPVTLVEGDDAVPIPQRRQRALLALLALRAGEMVATDRLVEELWGAEAPRTAVGSLHNAVSQLRKLLGPNVLLTQGSGYRLDPTCVNVDIATFEHLLADARAARSMQDDETAGSILREALGLWHGHALADLAYEPFAQAEIRRLEELRQTALEERIEVDLARGRHEQVVPELERLVADEPLRERVHGLLMLALYRAGRQADALASFRSARTALVDELGIEPGPELRELERAILRQDASLSLSGSSSHSRPVGMQFRRLATILFAEAAVESGVDRPLDEESLHRVLGAYADIARSTIGRHGGRVESVAGDVVMATFGAQAADETHARRAATAALELHAAMRALGERLDPEGLRAGLRAGIATGEVVVSGRTGREQLITGSAVRLAASLQRVASVGEVVIGPFARRLLEEAIVEPLGTLVLPGRPDPVAAFRLLGLSEDSTAGPGLEAPFVGRARELRALRAALRTARTDEVVRAALVLGPAGIGKSRLAREAVAGARGFDVLVARCPSHGEGLTYLPVRQLVGLDADEIRSALGSGPEADDDTRCLVSLDGTAADIARAFRAWCEGRATRMPLLLVIDDLHWAEQTFLELLDELVGRGRGRIALLGIAREELLEEHPAGLAGAVRVELDGLTLAEAGNLVDNIQAGAALSDAVRARAFEAAEGNPLFLEQLVALAAEGTSVEAEQALPATVQALLAARLDRLGPGERAVLERAAVVGRDFLPEQVAALLDPEAVPTAARHLAALERRGFVRARRQGSGLRFRHVLVQEATYRATPKSVRSLLHERLADALDRDEGTADAVVGYHLERAYQLRIELARPDRAARRIAEDAGRRLGAAGLQAWYRYDAPAAVNLLRRAVALLPDHDPDRLGFLCELGEVFKWMHEFEPMAEVLAEVEELGRAANDARAVARSQVQRAWTRFAAGEIDTDDMLRLTTHAIPVFEAHGDERALGLAWRVVAAVHGPIRGHWGRCADAASRALEHYERTPYSPAPCLTLLGAALEHGPEPADSALERCEALVAAARSDPTVHAHMLVILAALEAMRGSPEAGRAHLAAVDAFLQSHGGGAWHDRALVIARIELDAGAPERAAGALEEAIEVAAAQGEDAWVATLDALLAEVRLDQGDTETALSLANAAMGLAPHDDVFAQTGWRRARARTLAATGNSSEAETLVREALALLDDRDDIAERAETLTCLAEVLLRGSRFGEADEASAAAYALYDAKGDRGGRERTRRRLARLEPATA